MTRDELQALYKELELTLRTTEWQPLAVEVGRRLNRLGGREAMFLALKHIKSSSLESMAGALSLCWSGIGWWDSSFSAADDLPPLPDGHDAQHEPIDSSWEELNTAGAWALLQGRLLEAERLFSGAKATLASAGSTQSQQFAATLTNLAMTFEQLGKTSEAEQNFRSALKMAEAVCGPNHEQTASILMHMGLYFFRQGNEEVAASLLARAEEVLPFNTASVVLRFYSRPQPTNRPSPAGGREGWWRFWRKKAAR